MSDGVVGKATLVVGADTSEAGAKLRELGRQGTSVGAEVARGGETASAGLNNIGTAATAASRTVEQAQARWIRSAETLAETYGKPRSALLEYQAIQRGIKPDVYEPIIAKVRQAEQATTGLGMSAAATAAAMRNVPAQFSDIVVSLQGGQSAMTVALQQGAQLKDMFGGLGPAAQALGGYIKGLIGPFTLAAAAAAVLSFAYYQGSKESDGYNRAIVLTGNYAGLTAGRMTEMARSISDVQGTQGAAAEALTTIASGARVAGQDVQRFAAVAVSANRTIGQSYEETGKIFAKLADDPVKASVELNRSLGYLTAGTYDQIRAAEEMGRTDEAGAIAQRAYADAMEKRMTDLRSQAGTVERAWGGITSAAKTAWDAMLNIGRPTAPSDIRKQAEALQSQISDLLAAPGGFTSTGGGAATGSTAGRQNQALVQLRRQLAELQPALAKAAADDLKAGADAAERKRNQESIDAKARLDGLIKATRSRKQVRDEEADQIRRDALKSGMSDAERDKLIAAVNVKYKDAAGPKPKAYADDAGTRMLLQLREQEAAQRAQLGNAEKLTGAAAELAKFEQQIADLKEKKVLTADQKSLLAAQDQIKAQLQKNVQVEKEVKAKEAAEKLDKERQKDLERYNERYVQLQSTIDSAQRARAEQYDRQLSSFGQGDKAFERQQATQAIYREYQRYQQELDKSTPLEQLGSDDYRAKTQNLAAQLQTALQMQKQYYGDLDGLQSDWSNGSRRAFANYLDTVRNVSGATESLLGNAFKGAEDAFVRFTQTGKLSFDDLITSISAGIARLAVQQNITGPLFQFLSSAAGSFFGSTSTGLTNGDTSTLAPGYSSLGLKVAGNRADGGDVSAGKMYEVNERGVPELLTVGGRQLLMMADQSGTVTPLVARPAGGAASSGAPQVYITVEDHNGNDVQATATTGDNGEVMIDLVVKKAVAEVAGQINQGQGPAYKAVKGRFGLRDAFA